MREGRAATGFRTMGETMKKKLVALAAAVATLALSAVMLAGCSGGGDAQQQGGDSGATDGAFTLTVRCV